MENLVAKENRQKLLALFLSIAENAQPLWGKMKPQQMVEHLIEQVQYTNGTLMPGSDRSPEDAARFKQLMIYTDTPIRQNVFLGLLPEHYSYPDLCTAANQLLIELAAFDAFFDTPGKTVLHGGFGLLTYEEWLIWHGKHFRHHLKQFGLI